MTKNRTSRFPTDRPTDLSLTEPHPHPVIVTPNTEPGPDVIFFWSEGDVVTGLFTSLLGPKDLVMVLLPLFTHKRKSTRRTVDPFTDKCVRLVGRRGSFHLSTKDGGDDRV